MQKEILLDQIDFAQARIEEIEKQVINANPTDKGYKELVDSYNKWIDRYNVMMDKLEHFEDLDVEKERANLERDKMTINEMIERDRINLESEKLRLEREKFAYETQVAKRKEPLDIIFRVGDLGVKVLVPVLGVTATLAVAGLAYSNDAELKLCNGRVFGQAKEIMKIALRV